MPLNQPASPAPDPALEDRLRSAGRALAYPPGPDLAAREGRRVRQLATRARPRRARGQLVAGGLLVVILLVVSALLVEPVRASMLEFLQLGAVRIFLGEPTPMTTPSSGSPSPVVFDLSGATTLAEAAAQAPFAVRLPAYPPELAEPQQVFLQRVEGVVVVISVWLDPAKPDVPRLALYQIGKGNVFEKRLLNDFVETFVGGDWALWVEGPHLLLNAGGDLAETRLVAGHALIWTAEDLTYRLETGESLEEARRIAESLVEWGK